MLKLRPAVAELTVMVPVARAQVGCEVTDAVGAAGAVFIVTDAVAGEMQPVVVLVKVKVADPPETPDTKPAFVTVATALLLLAQVPPVVGESVVVAPTQIEFDPVMLTTGKILLRSCTSSEVAQAPLVIVHL